MNLPPRFGGEPQPSPHEPSREAELLWVKLYDRIAYWTKWGGLVLLSGGVGANVSAIGLHHTGEPHEAVILMAQTGFVLNLAALALEGASCWMTAQANHIYNHLPPE